jgi:hypothetical protein
MSTPANDLNIQTSGYVVFDGVYQFFGRTFQAGPGISLTNASGIAGNTTISATGAAPNYTNVTHAMSPYTVLPADEYISVDCSGGIVTLNFPNAPTFKETWIVKDRTGNASEYNITLTTPGGTDLFDGATTYVMNSNYSSVQLLANAVPAYEIF